MSSNNNTAIARRVTPEIIKANVEQVVAVTSNPIRTITELQHAYEALRGKCNLLTPITHPNDIQPLHRVSMGVVMINPDPKGPHCYYAPAFHDQGECSLNKTALLMLMQAAGLSLVGTQKVDDGSEKFYSAYNVSVYGRDLRGIWRTVSKEGRSDFRDGSMMIKGWGAAQLSSARAHIDSRAETKAMSKCIREFLAVQGKYKATDLALPFVIPVLVADPDPSHPVDRAWLLNQGNARTERLFGALPAAGAEEAREVKTVSPPPPLKTTPPPPLGSVTSEEEEDDNAGDQLDLLDVEEDAKPILCKCPCGDQTEVDAKLAQDTEEKYGAVRCRYCAPTKAFDFGRHKDLRGGILGLPKLPNVTVDALRKKLDEMAATAGRTR
jgi:hypothetical protein